MDNRLTCVLKKGSGDAWKVVHEHSAAPADFETDKVVPHR